VPRHQLAAVHELAQLTRLSMLSGETLGRLADRMERVELDPGEVLDPSAGGEGRFYLILAGILQTDAGLLRAGDAFGGPEPVPSSIRALVPSAVAACDRETYDRYIGPVSGP
jgi:hypothetical protein